MASYSSADGVRQGQQYQSSTFSSAPNDLALSKQAQDRNSQVQSTQHFPRGLDQNQQHLLVAALKSQSQNTYPAAKATDIHPSTTDSQQQSKMSVMSGNTLFMSPQQAELEGSGDYTPDLDFYDGDGSFDFEDADLGGSMIGALPEAEQHDKRKNPDEADDNEEGDAKRQETSQDGGKGAKKPGRKPLTSEPTTVSCMSLSTIT